jgi:hypothetical protein
MWIFSAGVEVETEEVREVKRSEGKSSQSNSSSRTARLCSNSSLFKSL